MGWTLLIKKGDDVDSTNQGHCKVNFNVWISVAAKDEKVTSSGRIGYAKKDEGTYEDWG